MNYDSHHYEQLLLFAWQNGFFLSEKLYTRDGERVEIIHPGRRNPEEGPEFLEAKIRLGDKILVGAVSVHVKSSDWGYYKHNYDKRYDAVILQIVSEDDRLVRKIDDSILPAVEVSCPDSLQRAHRTLISGAGVASCGCHLTRLISEIEFKAAYTRLMIDRLERKYNDILSIYKSVEKSWHETFYILLFRTMGLSRNKEIYISLARSVPYAKICQERGDPVAIEAMLFGVAGLLDSSLYDEYKAGLAHRFEDLRQRYDLKVMTYCEWSEKGVRPYNFVPKRIAQLAALVNSPDFTFNNILSCESVQDIRHMFRVPLPEYWRRSFSFGRRTEAVQKTIGEETIDILIINLIVPILFAYGRLSEREELEERALDFLYMTRPEKNRFTEPWSRHGVKVEHALASQALIQLSMEYCLLQRCCDCFIGSKVLRTSLQPK